MGAPPPLGEARHPTRQSHRPSLPALQSEGGPPAGAHPMDRTKTGAARTGVEGVEISRKQVSPADGRPPGRCSRAPGLTGQVRLSENHGSCLCRCLVIVRAARDLTPFAESSCATASREDSVDIEYVLRTYSISTECEKYYTNCSARQTLHARCLFNRIARQMHRMRPKDAFYAFAIFHF